MLRAASPQALVGMDEVTVLLHSSFCVPRFRSGSYVINKHSQLYGLLGAATFFAYAVLDRPAYPCYGWTVCPLNNSEWNLFTTRAELTHGIFVVAHDCDLSIREAETRGPPTAQWELLAAKAIQ